MEKRDYGKVHCTSCGCIVKDTAIDEEGRCPSCSKLAAEAALDDEEEGEEEGE
jgi:transcription initiation factor TFIIIB Brf1 subunit/transcription initiation factor TFIIB